METNGWNSSLFCPAASSADSILAMEAAKRSDSSMSITTGAIFCLNSRAKSSGCPCSGKRQKKSPITHPFLLEDYAVLWNCRRRKGNNVLLHDLEHARINVLHIFR